MSYDEKYMLKLGKVKVSSSSLVGSFSKINGLSDFKFIGSINSSINYEIHPCISLDAGIFNA